MNKSLLFGWISLFLLVSGSAYAQNCSISLSHNPGSYSEPILLQVESSAGCTIRYTQDGTVPTVNSAQYAGPIMLTEQPDRDPLLSFLTNISHDAYPFSGPAGIVPMIHNIRLAAFDQSGVSSEVITASYLIGNGVHSGLPVVSLTIDQDDFFADDIGIYALGDIFDQWAQSNPGVMPDGSTPANYRESGDEWERPVYFEYFDEFGQRALAQTIGVRIHGGWTRQYPKKSLRLYSRNEYGTSRFRYRFFPNKDLENFNRLILRNSGQDWADSKFRDAYIYSLISHYAAASQAYQPVILFLNGEFWGLYNLRERLDQHYLETIYGVHRDLVDMVEMNGEVNHGEDVAFNELIQFFSENTFETDDMLYKAMDIIDFGTLLDHYAVNIFVSNYDWPNVNQRIWRKRVDSLDTEAPLGHDGRWRWVVYDMDVGFWSGNLEYDMIEHVLRPEGHGWNPNSNLIFRKLMENEKFRTRFILRLQEEINITFDTQRSLSVLEKLADRIKPFIEPDNIRWNIIEPESGQIRNLNDWDVMLGYMREFARQRPAIMTQHIMNHFGYVDQNSLSIILDDPTSGTVTINDINPVWLEDLPLDQFYPYQRSYFTGLTYRFEATPAEGYRFIRWEGDITSDSTVVIFNLDQDVMLRPIFEAIDSDYKTFPVELEIHKLYDAPYQFSFWDPMEPEGSFPASMYFVQSMKNDPSLRDELNFVYGIPESEFAIAEEIGFPYSTSSRTRISGLGDQGIGFINTGRGRDLGAAVLVLDATDVSEIAVSWKSETLVPNQREYNLRLQYRTQLLTPWMDVLDHLGNPLEYTRNSEKGIEERIGPFVLPDSLSGEPALQLRWKYYHTGVGNSGPRDMIRLDDILVTARRNNDIDMPEGFRIIGNYPNPFNNSTRITYELQQSGMVTVKVFDAIGRLISSPMSSIQDYGTHNLNINATGWASGVYLYTVEFNGYIKTGKMLLLK